MKLVYPVVLAVLIIALAVSVPLFTSSKEDFSTYNEGWNGASHAKDLARQTHPVIDALNLGDALTGTDRGLLVIMNPATSVRFTDDDLNAIRVFVQGGGTLLLANDFGNGNRVLDGLELIPSVKFNTSLLLDDVHMWAGSAFPRISSVTQSPLTTGVEELRFNYATALDIADKNVAPLAVSSPSSYLSANTPNPDQADTTSALARGAQPVLAQLPYGKGTIVLLSDPSIFINGMLGEADNARLYQNLITQLTSGDTTVPVLFDEAHRATQPLWTAAYDTVQQNDTLKYGIALVALSLFAVVTALYRITRPKPTRIDLNAVNVDADAVIGDILRRNPEWNPTYVKKFIKSLRRREDSHHDDK